LAQPKNVKFNFLHTTDPYHKYYQYKITEVKEGPEAAKAAFQASNSLAGAQPTEIAQPQVEKEAPPPTQELKAPEEEKYTASIPAGLHPQVLLRQSFTAFRCHDQGSLCLISAGTYSV
jgi:splicing factor 3A subunit 1